MVLALSISSFWVFILPRFSSPISPLFLAYAVVIQPANTITILPGSTEKLKAQSNIVRFSNHARRKGPLEMSSSRGERFAPTFRLFPRGSVTAAMAVARHGFDIPGSYQDLFPTTETQRMQRVTPGLPERRRRAASHCLHAKGSFSGLSALKKRSEAPEPRRGAIS